MRTLRARLTATSVAAAAVGLALGVWGLSAAVEGFLVERLHRDLAADAQALARADATSAVAIVERVPLDRLAQLQGPDGNVIAASAHRIRQSPDLQEVELLVAADGDTDDGWVTGSSDLRGLGAGWQTLTVASMGVDGAQVTLAAPSADLDAAVDAFTFAAIASIPLLLTMTGLLLWTALGRSLRPVDHARRQAAAAVDVYPPPTLRSTGGGTEIDALIATFDDLLARSAAGVRSQRRFLADAAHELLSPLAVLRTNLEVARRRDATPDVQRALDRCIRTQARLEALSQQLLALARAEDTADLDDTDLDLADLLRDAAEDIVPAAGVAIELDAVERLPMTGDPVALRQLIDNLLANASRYAVTRVTIALYGNRDAVHLHVDDDGPGIPPPDRHAVFQPFVRLEPGRDRRSGGAGLGLAIAHAVADRHGGTIEVGDSPLGGARLSVVLPRRGVELSTRPR